MVNVRLCVCVQSRPLRLASTILGTFLLPSLANAQIVPDATLGTQAVGACSGMGGTCGITNGTTRDSNLFHSFQQFSLPNGDVADFQIAPTIQNVIVRITGQGIGFVSNINGTISTSNPANFFLLNPNGILFGPGARLDVGRSFIATTASAIAFGDQGIFSVTDPQAPPLLSVNPSALLFNQINNGAIVASGSSLLVNQGQSLVLAGNRIDVSDNSFLGVRLYDGGRVELGAVAGDGTVGLKNNGDEVRLHFPDSLLRGDISIRDSFIDVSASNGGSIGMTAHNLDISGSVILAGVETNSGTNSSQAGDIVFNATGAVTIRGVDIQNEVESGATGNGGNIFIAANSLTATNGFTISARTLGQGNGGNIFIDVQDGMTLDQANAGVGAIRSTVQPGATGNAGNIQITTGSLVVTNSASLLANTSGIGNAGNIIINARDLMLLNGSDGNNVSSSVDSEGVGNGGNIQITTGSLIVKNSGSLSVGTLGQGNAGNIVINAQDAVVFDGVSSSNGISSFAASVVSSTGIGNGGDIQITAKSLSFTDGAYLATDVLSQLDSAGNPSSGGRGNAGNIIINALDSVLFEGSAFDRNQGVFVSSRATTGVSRGAVGNGGNIQITTGSLFLNRDARLDTGATGQGISGSITINARNTVSVTNGGTLSTSAIGQGKAAGNIAVNAGDSIIFQGEGEIYLPINGSNFFNPSSAISFFGADGVGGKGGDITFTARTISLKKGSTLSSFTFGQGDAGNIRIDARNQVLVDNADLTTATFGQGNAGNIVINAGDRILFQGDGTNGSSGAFSQVDSKAVGRGGDITLTTKTFTLTEGMILFSATFGQGDAGNIQINAQDAVVFDAGQGRLTGAYSAIFNGIGNSGNITVNSGSLTLLGGAQVNASTLGLGNGGTITANVQDAIMIDGVSRDSRFSGIFSTIEGQGSGKGGDIQIAAKSLSLNNQARISSSSLATGAAGDINISAATIRLSDNSLIAAATNTGQGGNITLSNVDLLLLRRGSSIFTTAGLASAGGDGGNIRFNGKFIVAVLKENSDISANAYTGKGGRVDITAQGIYGIQVRPRLTPFSDITASSTFGLNGVVTLNTPNVDPNRGLVQLPLNLIDTNRILASSCIVRNRESGGVFLVTGVGGLPVRPGDPPLSGFATGEVRSLSNATSSQPSTPETSSIVEAEGIYQLPDGQVILSWECRK